MADKPKQDDETTTTSGTHAQPDGMNPHELPDSMNPHAQPDGMNPHELPDGMNPHVVPEEEADEQAAEKS